jgi:hypothetical protein
MGHPNRLTLVTDGVLNDELKGILSPILYYFDSDNWREIITQMGIEDGACIPTAYVLAKYLTRRGIPAKPIEAQLTVKDTQGDRWMQTDPAPSGFQGHLVTYLPTKRIMIDASLRTQGSKVLALVTEGDIPHLYAGSYDHTKHRYVAGTIGRGLATYELFPEATVWLERNWPWEGLRQIARRLARMYQ